MTKQEAQQYFNEEFQSRLRSTIFPNEQLHKNFDLWKHACLQFESPVSVRSTGLSWVEYKVMMMKINNYNLFEFAIVVNMMENKTPNQIQPYITDNYYEMQAEVIRLTTEWNKIVDPIRESVQKKIEIMSTAGGQMNTQPLKFVKGEA